jgi:nicotinamidase-related amidase
MKLADVLAPQRVAVVLTEVQEGIVGSNAPWPALAEAAQAVGLIDNAARLAAAARRQGAPVIHCTAEHLRGRFGGNVNARLFGSAKKVRGADSEGNPLDAPLPAVWQDGDIRLPRFHGISAMTGSPLDSLLRNHGVTTVIVAGVSLSFGVLSLVLDAVNRAYQVVLPRDAVAGFPQAYAQQVMDNTLSMLATIATTDEILAAWG